MAKPTHSFRFDGKASHPKNAIALIYDLEGFSRFFNQPDVQDYVPIFLNKISEAVGACLYGGNIYWTPDSSNASPLKFQVVHEKFMGDGALYVILPEAGVSDFRIDTLQILCNRLWNLKSHFDVVVRKALEVVPVVEVPRRIRFGLSRGAVYELRKAKTTNREYIGFCINQASRLQNYCPDLGFIASARVMIPEKTLLKHGYKKVVATQIKGFPRELVIVDKDEYDSLDEVLRTHLFAEKDSAA